MTLDDADALCFFEDTLAMSKPCTALLCPKLNVVWRGVAAWLGLVSMQTCGHRAQDSHIH